MGGRRSGGARLQGNQLARKHPLHLPVGVPRPAGPPRRRRPRAVPTSGASPWGRETRQGRGSPASGRQRARPSAPARRAGPGRRPARGRPAGRPAGGRGRAAGPTAAASDVARSASSAGNAAWLTLMPMPRTTWRICSRSVAISVRMPASLRGPAAPASTQHVVGPLQPGLDAAAGQGPASTSPRPPRPPGSAGAAGAAGTGGRSSSEKYRFCPAGESQLRPSRPRPPRLGVGHHQQPLGRALAGQPGARGRWSSRRSPAARRPGPAGAVCRCGVPGAAGCRGRPAAQPWAGAPAAAPATDRPRGPSG